MAFAGKTFLAGILLGIIIIVIVETLVALAFLSSEGVKNPFQFTGALLRALPSLSSLNISKPGAYNTSKASTIGEINVSRITVYGVTYVHATGLTNGNVTGELKYTRTLPGFSTSSYNTFNYSLSIPNYSQFNMTLLNITTDNGFSIESVSPKLPYSLAPNSTVKLVALIKAPKSYTGILQINYTAEMTK